MASVDRATECTVCFETFVNPKLLPCRHSYCEKCIQELTKGSKLQCPVCKSFCDVDQIVHDFQTENFVLAFQELEEEFNRKLDAATAAIHPKPSVPSEQEITAPKNCELCSDNDIAFWCVECKQWICISCKKIHLNTKYTKDHHIEKLSVKNGAVKSQLQTEINGLKVKMDEFYSHIKALQAEKRNTQGIQIKTLQESKELRDQCILEINNSFNRIDNEILKGIDEYTTLLEREISKHQKGVSELEKTYESFVATMRKKDRSMAIDGDIIINQAKDLVTKTRSPEMCIANINVKLQRLQEWSAKVVTLEISGGRTTTMERPTLADPSLELVSKRTWNRHQTVSIPDYAHHNIRNIRNRLYLCHSDGITLYTMMLKQVKTIRFIDVGDVYDVCDMVNGDLLIATKNCLYHTKANGIILQRLHGGLFTGVVCHKNRYYAANITTFKIHVHCYTNAWKRLQLFSVNASAYIITLGIMNNLIYTCLFGHSRIDIFSLNGQLKSSTGRHGTRAAGQLNMPLICDTDTAGAVIIADRGRLQSLSANGDWSCVQLEPSKGNIDGACLVNGTLYIFDSYKKMLHAYKT